MTVLAKSAIKGYIKRRLDDWNRMKKLRRPAILNQMRMRWGHAPIFKTDPYLHQLQALYAALRNDRFGLFLSMGTGKTKIAIDLVTYLQDFRGAGKALIVCFNEASVYGWVEEVHVHSDVLEVVPCVGSQKEKAAMLRLPGDAYLMTYSGLFSYCTDLVKGKGGKRKRKIVPSLLHSLPPFDIIVFDEAHKLMRAVSGVSEVCRSIADECRWVYGMTGTPTGRDPGALFSEMLVIDKGESFGTHVEVFNSVFYKTLWVSQGRRRGFPKRTVVKRMLPDLRRMLQHRSITYESEECFEVPAVVRKCVRVPMTKEMREHHKALVELARNAEEENFIRNIFARYRQLMGGTLVLDPFDGGEKVEITLEVSPKVEQMVELVEQTTSKVVVFYEYNATGDIAESVLKGSKIVYSRLRGGLSQVDRVVDKFRKGKAKVLLCQWRVGGTALNLQAADTVIFLESPCSYIERQQCEARIRPHLQTRSFIYDLVVAKTLDERILEYHKEGADLFKAVVGGKTKLFEEAG